MVPMLLAMIPLPMPEITPPVTRMYFICLAARHRHRLSEGSPPGRRGQTRCLEEPRAPAIPDSHQTSVPPCQRPAPAIPSPSAAPSRHSRLSVRAARLRQKFPPESRPPLSHQRPPPQCRPPSAGVRVVPPALHPAPSPHGPVRCRPPPLTCARRAPGAARGGCVAGGVRDGARAALLPAGSAGKRMRPARGGAQAQLSLGACAVGGQRGGYRAAERAGRGRARPW